MEIKYLYTLNKIEPKEYLKDYKKYQHHQKLLHHLPLYLIHK